MPGFGTAATRRGDFLGHVRRRFIADRCPQAAGALAYTTMLALVSLFTVVCITLTAFPAFRDWQTAVEEFAFRHFVPAFGDQVREYLDAFAANSRATERASHDTVLPG